MWEACSITASGRSERVLDTGAKSPALGSLVAALLVTTSLACRAEDRRPLTVAGLTISNHVHDWSGPYVGGHMSYDVGGTDTSLTGVAPQAGRSTFGDFRGGLQAGVNWVAPSRVMFGVEADVTFPYFLDNRNVLATRATAAGSFISENVEASGTLRARLGYATNRWMVYGTGGLAWSKEELFETPGAVDNNDKLSRWRLGWALGAGAEMALSPAWSARAEYLYTSFGSARETFPSAYKYASSTEQSSFRLGIDRKLGVSDADDAADSDRPGETVRNWSIHGQATFVEQGYPSFRSPYMGVNSLQGSSQIQNTTSATAFVGVRPWAGTEIYFNPELMQGSGLSQTYGVAGYPNGEAQKSGFPMPRVDMARMYVRQTFGLGGEREKLEDGPNQIAGDQDISRVTLSAGRFAVNDVFQGNSYAADPRRDFLNWNAYGWGSYDITMNKIGYTWGAIADLNQKDWALRAGYFLLPTTSNTNTFDTAIPDRGQYTLEGELRYSMLGQPGKFRVFGWFNRGIMGNYEAALAFPVSSPSYADITQTRTVRTNYGIVLNAEQAITDDLGMFARASWSPGQQEILGWTDVSEALTIGLLLKGTAWGRPDDRIGVAGAIEGLSPQARAFFAAGGLGILIGDGALSYKPERLIETYYALSLGKSTTLTADYQFVDNLAYNADRGPVSFYALRLHTEF